MAGWFLGVLGASGLAAEPLADGLEPIVRAALANDPRMKELGLAAREQAALEACWTADRGLVLNLGGSPLVQAAFGSGQTTVLDFGLGLGINLRLPGEGSLSAGLAHHMTTQLATGGTAWSQSPTLTFGWQQPMFINGQLVDPGLTAAARTLQVELPARRLSSRERTVANAVVAEVAHMWFNVALLGDTAALQRERIALAAGNREILSAKQKLGQASTADLGKAGLELGRLEAALIETERARSQLLARLAAACGGPVTGPEIAAFDAIPSLDLPGPEDRRAETANSAAAVVAASADAAEAAANLVAAGRESAPVLGLHFSLRPSPAPGPTADFAGSFTALGATGAAANPVVGLELSLPLGDGGRAATNRDLARAKNAAALGRRDEAVRDSLRKLEEIEGRRESSRRKIELYDRQLVWQDGQIDIVAAQLQLGAALAQDLAQARADRAETAVEHRRARLEQFAADLELLDICGHSLARELGLAARREGQS